VDKVDVGSDETGGEGEGTGLARDSLEEEKGVSVSGVVKVLLGEKIRGVLEEVEPIFGDAFESDEGFHRKSFENVDYNVVGQKLLLEVSINHF